ncbi:MAG: DUF308 domain-containing protein [Lachnospiraceae bacterium]|nr:DUF308 domain-containing protein [Lachnospiraceae bacterium]
MKAAKSGSLISLIVMGGVGLLLFLFPGWSLELVVKILGIGLLIFGAVGLISAVMQKRFGASDIADLVGKIVALVVGLICLFRPGTVTGLFNLVLGVLVIWHSISNLLGALDIRKLDQKWQAPLLLSIIGIIAGILIITGVFGALVIRIAGLILIYNAVVGVWVEAKR